jgi:hypothetical protein
MIQDFGMWVFWVLVVLALILAAVLIGWALVKALFILIEW